MTIVFDLDDVLANLRESLYRTLSRATGVDLHWRDWTHYDLRRHYDVGDDWLEDILIAERTMEVCQPEPGAAETTRLLIELGFELVIVTARGWHPQAETLTREWLETHRIAYDELLIVPLGADKLAALTDYDHIALAVDDHPHNTFRYQQAGIPTLLMDRPWNADAAGERIYSLDVVVTRAVAARRAKMN